MRYVLLLFFWISFWVLNIFIIPPAQPAQAGQCYVCDNCEFRGPYEATCSGQRCDAFGPGPEQEMCDGDIPKDKKCDLINPQCREYSQEEKAVKNLSVGLMPAEVATYNPQNSASSIIPNPGDALRALINFIKEIFGLLFRIPRDERQMYDGADKLQQVAVPNELYSTTRDAGDNFQNFLGCYGPYNDFPNFDPTPAPGTTPSCQREDIVKKHEVLTEKAYVPFDANIHPIIGATGAAQLTGKPLQW